MLDSPRNLRRTVAFPPSELLLGNRPLGTASFHQFALNTQPSFNKGDLWLSRSADGDPVGLNDDRHVLVVGGTRSDKGTSVIIPNLCLWRGSAVVAGPKADNAVVTARQRGNGSMYSQGMGQKIGILAPLGDVSRPDDQLDDLKVCYNPLDLIDVDDEESVDTAFRIADSIVVIEGSKEAFFDENARDSLLKGLILHVASSEDYKDHERNLITVRKLLLAGEIEMRQILEMNEAEYIPSAYDLLFEGMRRNPAFDGVIAQEAESLSRLSEQSPRTFASIVQVACTHTAFIDSPGMKRCLAKSDFQLSELKTNPQGFTLYMCLPQRFMETHFRWLRMMLSLITTEMERVQGQPACGHPVLMLIDEFAALRRMKVIENAAAQIAEAGVKMMFVVQSLAQLKDVYKDNWESFISNAGAKLFFGNDDHFTRDYVSKLIGECEVVRTSQTKNQTTGHSTSRATGTSFSETTGKTVNRSVSHARGRSSGVSRGPSIASFTSNYGSNQSRTIGHSWSENESTTEGRSETLTQSKNESVSEGENQNIHKRALLTPDEVGRYFGDRENPTALALISGQQPLLLQRARYFQDTFFNGLFDPHPDHPRPPTLYEHQLMQKLGNMSAQLSHERTDNKAKWGAGQALHHTVLEAEKASLLANLKKRVIMKYYSALSVGGLIGALYFLY